MNTFDVERADVERHNTSISSMRCKGVYKRKTRPYNDELVVCIEG